MTPYPLLKRKSEKGVDMYSQMVGKFLAILTVLLLDLKGDLMFKFHGLQRALGGTMPAIICGSGLLICSVAKGECGPWVVGHDSMGSIIWHCDNFCRKNLEIYPENFTATIVEIFCLLPLDFLSEGHQMGYRPQLCVRMHFGTGQYGNNLHSVDRPFSGAK